MKRRPRRLNRILNGFSSLFFKDPIHIPSVFELLIFKPDRFPNSSKSLKTTVALVSSSFFAIAETIAKTTWKVRRKAYLVPRARACLRAQSPGYQAIHDAMFCGLFCGVSQRSTHNGIADFHIVRGWERVLSPPDKFSRWRQVLNR